MGIGLFPGVKRSGCGDDQPPTPSAEVKERIELYLCSPLWALWQFIGCTLTLYRCADKSLVRPTSGCILFDGENISFDAGLVIYINSTNIPPIIIIINRIYEHQNLLLL